MIIDFHTHTFPDKIAPLTIDTLKNRSHTIPFLDGTNDALSKNGVQAKIDLSIILPVVTNPLKTQKINDSANLVNDNYQNLFSFGGIHPETPNPKDEIKRIYELGLKGIKIHPAYQQVKLDDIKFKRIIGYAEEYGLVTISHGGIDIGVDGDWANPKMAKNILVDVRPQKFVMAHLGGWLFWDEVLDTLCGENIYFDTAFCYGSFYYQSNYPTEKQRTPISQEKITKIIKSHGSDKILFGTDSPWGDRFDQIEKISNLPLNETEKQDIFSNTAKKLLNI